MHNERHICRACGMRWGVHKGGNCDMGPIGRCPREERDPAFPHKLAERKGEEHADRVWAKRLAKHWAARDTIFDPR